jgi:dihydroneopterin aldolase
MKLRRFQISASLFWGWQSTLDIEEYDTIEKICDKIKKDLKRHFQQTNLLELAEKVDSLHIHTHDDITRIFSDTVEPFPNDIFYLCDHC